MDSRPQLPEGRGAVFSMLNEAMKDLNIAKEASSITPAKAVFGSVGALLPTIRVSQSVVVGRSLTIERLQDSSREGYVELGLACADVCRTLDRGLNGRQADQLSWPVFEAIEQLTR